MSGIEIERKFLVRDSSYKAEAAESHHLVQGYICRGKDLTVRVRIADSKAFLTVKGRSSADGTSRPEWEMEIPADEAGRLMAFCRGGIIDKTRYIVPALPAERGSGGEAGKDRVWEVDEFHGDNEGLVVAEIELGSAGEAFARPGWLGDEVTGDSRYYNSMLAGHPYRTWPL